MQKKVQIEIDEELYENIQLLKQLIPLEEGEWEMNDNEVLKLVVWTFMAFAAGEEWKEDKEEGSECWCGNGWCGCH